VGVGQQTQIGGANFVGAASVTVTLTTAQGTRTLATVKPDPKDGSFTLTYSPTARDLGAANLSAASTPDGDAPSALQASAQLQIVAAAPTATTPPSIPTVASARPTTASTASGSSLAASVLLMVGSLLVVLFLIGAVAWIFLMPVRARRRRGAAARSRIGAWGSADSSYGFAPPHPLDDSSAGSASYPTLYPHDAPTVGPAREWRAPSHAGGAPRAAQGRSWASSSSHTPSPRRRSNGTWAPSESEARPATSRAPGNLDLPSLDPGASQASTSESATFDEQRWDR
jgi:hypothetical protein